MFPPRSGCVSDCGSAEAGSATSFARFEFATTVAIKHQYLRQSRHLGDRTNYLHWLFAKQADWSGTIVRHSRCTFGAPRREKNEDNDAGSVSAALFQLYFVPEEKRFRRRTLARENHCKRLICSKSRGNSSRIIHQLHAAQDCCRSQRGASQKRDGGLQAYPLTGKLMSKSENRCADCGSKLGLVSHHHWGLRFCRKACKDNFLAKSAQDHARMRKWFGFFARATT